jgi:hypothetical protein
MTQCIRKVLSSCNFQENNDLEYLLDDGEWIESRSEKLKLFEKETLIKLVQRLHSISFDAINESFFCKLLSNCFERQYIKQMIQEKRKVSVRMIFLATVVREIILRCETNEAMEEGRETFLNKYSFLNEQEGTDTELTWLNRYERALRYLMLLMPAEKNKQTFINIGAHLQGSDVYTEYITGGANKPETQRRVDIYEAVTNVKPVQRTPRSSSCSAFSPKGIDALMTPKRGRGRPRKDQPITPSSTRNLKKNIHKSYYSSSSCHSFRLDSFSMPMTIDVNYTSQYVDDSDSEADDLDLDEDEDYNPKSSTRIIKNNNNYSGHRQSFQEMDDEVYYDLLENINKQIMKENNNVCMDFHSSSSSEDSMSSSASSSSFSSSLSSPSSSSSLISDDSYLEEFQELLCDNDLVVDDDEMMNNCDSSVHSDITIEEVDKLMLSEYYCEYV